MVKFREGDPKSREDIPGFVRSSFSGANSLASTYRYNIDISDRAKFVVFLAILHLISQARFMRHDRSMLRTTMPSLS